MAAWTRAQLGEERLRCLSQLPIMHVEEGYLALFHASPTDPWRIQLDALSRHPLVVYGHTHRPSTNGRILNSGSVGQPHDGDPRASYLLIDDGEPQIRRVEYDREKELKALSNVGLPHANWIARILEQAKPLSEFHNPLTIRE